MISVQTFFYDPTLDVFILQFSRKDLLTNLKQPADYRLILKKILQKCKEKMQEKMTMT